ncbi:unnamed protein product [Clonostachys solani]|uniref:Nephrocystin 3-like N-terminal domain-containing protein n=1 Tax=Clonostachys solani TaxID=160281 RepID=A0A9N9ZB32_9HYPO|nr:unnamed protein product [Clonostachys solani]
MSDPLSMSASIAGIISLGEVVFRNVYKYYRSAAGAKDEIKQIADQVNDLISVMRALEAHTLTLESEGQTFNPALRNHHLHRCNDTLRRIEKRIKKPLDQVSNLQSSRLSATLQKLKWPFSASEARELLAELSQQKQNVSLALGADSLQLLQESLTKLDCLTNDAAKMIKMAQQINQKILVDDKKRGVLDYFMPVNPQDRLDISIQLRHPTSGLWLTESSEFIRWLEVPASRIWLSGIPGAGKTVLAGAVVQEVIAQSYTEPDIGVGYFFCDYRDDRTWQPSNILGALAAQLAMQKPEAYDILQRYHEELHPPNRLTLSLDLSELRAVINRVSDVFSRVYLIVDGLDECGRATEDVVDILKELSNCATKESFAFFSRDHYDIRTHLEEEFRVISIAAKSEDINNYVSAELRRRIQMGQMRLGNSQLEAEIQEALVKRANGMFRWVVCQIDYLCNCAHDDERREALNTLPPDLPESYRRLLERVYDHSPRVQAIVQMVLRFIAFGKPLTIPQLTQAVSTPKEIGSTLSGSNTVSEQDISRWCSSLIRVSKSCFEFAHFSVKEFLLDRKALSDGSASRTNLESFLIVEETSANILTSQCLNFLQLQNFDREPPLSEEAFQELHHNYPFYLYAAMDVLSSIVDGISSPELLAGAIAFFRPSKTKNFSFWIFSVLCQFQAAYFNRTGDLARSKADEVVRDPNFQTIFLAAALGASDMCESLLRGGAPIDFHFRGTGLADAAVLATYAIFPHCDGARTAFQTAPEVFWPKMFAGSRRTETIQVLVQKGATLSKSLVLISESTFRFVSRVYFRSAFDFRPITTILRSGCFPQDGDLNHLKAQLLHPTTATVGDVLIETSWELLTWLADSERGEMPWISPLRAIVWQWALDAEMPYTTRFSELSSTKDATQQAPLPEDDDAFIQRIMNAVTAVHNNDLDELRRCINDERAPRKDQIYTRCGGTLLHCAVQRCALDAIKLLLHHGYDAAARNAFGNTPLHIAPDVDIKSIMHIFHDFGCSLSLQNVRGHTILHASADSRLDTILECMNSVSPQEMWQALLTRDNEGRTPLTLALSSNNSHHHEREKNVLSILQYCSSAPLGFWESHPPVIGLAALFGSEKIIASIVDKAGAFACRPPENVEDSWTALHEINPTTTLAAARCLGNLYPGGNETEFRGNLPFQSYLQRIFSLGNSVVCTGPELVLLELTPRSRYSDLWSSTCKSFKNLGYSQEDNAELMSRLVESFMRENVLAEYETERRASGLVPLFEACSHSISVLNSSILRCAISSTAHWEETRASKQSVRFLKRATSYGDSSVVLMLQEHGVDIHQRVDGSSAIEHACYRSIASQLCITEDGKQLLLSLLDKFDPIRAQELDPTGTGFDLLQCLVNSNNGLRSRGKYPDDSPQLSWLVRQLIQKGFDVKGNSQSAPATSILRLYIESCLCDCAITLIQLGADPWHADPRDQLDPVGVCIIRDELMILRGIMQVYHHEHPHFSNWAKRFDYIGSRNGKSFKLNDISYLHLSVALGRTDCASFLVRHQLSPDVNVASREGYTPLHLACVLGSMLGIRFCFSNQASLNARSVDGSTPLHIAVRNGHFAAVKALVTCGATNCLDILGLSPAMYASDLGLYDIQNYLEDAFATVNAHPHAALVKPTAPLSSLPHFKVFVNRLFDSIRLGRLEECKSLVQYGYSVESPESSRSGLSPLFVAVDQGQHEMVRLLLDGGASATRAFSIRGRCRSVLEYCITKKRLNVVLPQLAHSYLAEGGDLVNGADFPLHEAVRAKNLEGLRILIESVEKMTETLAYVYMHIL